MNWLLDQLVWLANFPANTGYIWVFVSGFGAFGVGRHMINRSGRQSRLTELRREREAPLGLRDRPVLEALRMIKAWLARVVFVGLIFAGAIGIASLGGFTPTLSYIHANGVTAPATLENDYVTFTASNGRTYTLPYDFFTTPAYPDRDFFHTGDGKIVVRYLESHPQAYVLDTELTPEE
ncbi:hypothetical protein [Microlunatus sp. GCM10028923]|uniref:hypothetical protein n=1 Tax=Microlunatus sp. GCM10028923 TaxID=3273400 RepID=UPI00360CF134